MSVVPTTSPPGPLGAVAGPGPAARPSVAPAAAPSVGPSEPGRDPTAAILLIGNELLSGKVADTNAAYLIGRLRALGVRLIRIAVVPDVLPVIAEELRRLAALADHVFTSGGVGPTHDDVTLASVAEAFEAPVVRHRELATLLTEHFGPRLRPDHLRMADVPAGTVLLWGGDFRWPVYTYRNVYILPGIPEMFRAKFDAIADRFAAGCFYLRSLYLNADEGAIAPALAALETRFGVEVGSYPRIDGADHRVRITVEARAAAPVNAAVEALASGLPAELVVRIDPALAEPT